MSDILNDLKTENNFAFGQLYKDNYSKIEKFVINNNGNPADAEDIFQDAMMVLVEKLRQDNFLLTASINTYVYAICKNLWFKKNRDKKYDLSYDELNSSEFLLSINESLEQEKTYGDKIKGYLLMISDHCNRLIQDLFFKQKSIEQIQKEFGYTTRHNAQNQKH